MMSRWISTTTTTETGGAYRRSQWGTYRQAHVTMGIDDNDDGHGGKVSTSTMFLPTRKHTIDNDDDGNGGAYRRAQCSSPRANIRSTMTTKETGEERINEHMSRWGLSQYVLPRLLCSSIRPPVYVVVVVDPHLDIINIPSGAASVHVRVFVVVVVIFLLRAS